MEECKNKLTEEQKKVVESNYGLIYKYAATKNISASDYFGLLSIGLCKAAMCYDEDRGAFSTLAFRCMENELYMYWNKLTKKSAIPESEIVSYDCCSSKESEDVRYDIIENFLDFTSTNDEEYAIMLDDIKRMLEEREMYVLNRLLECATHNEIADELGCSRSNIEYIIRCIRNKLYRYFYN